MKITITQGGDFDIKRTLAASKVGHVPNAELTMLSYIYSSAEVWVGHADDEIACVAGLIPPSMLSDRAYLWMLHTEIVEEHKFLFIRHSQIWIKSVLERYSEIYGHADVRLEKTIAWLRWLGTEFGQPDGFRIPFTIRKKTWTQ